MLGVIENEGEEVEMELDVAEVAARAGGNKVGKRRSGVWNYFQDTEDPKKAKCNICNKSYSRGGVGKKANTTTLRDHLRKAHKDMYSKLEAEELGVNSKAKNQKSIKAMILAQSTIKLNVNNPKAKEIHRAIGEMMAIDNQPYSLVENEGFNRLLGILVPNYEIPGRTYFTENIIPILYRDCKAKVVSQLEQAKYLSFTCDIWTAKISNEPFISLTAHWINNDFEPKQLVLNASHFPGSHTGQRITESLLKFLVDWNVGVDRRHMILTDTTANIVRGALDTGMEHGGCFFHKLQLAIHDSIDSQRMVIDIIKICRNIATHFNHSAVSTLKLHDIQTKLGEKKKNIKQDVATRWNATYYMLLSILEQKQALLAISGEIGVRVLEQNQWSVLESTLCLLQPFEVSKSERFFYIRSNTTVATLKRYLEKDNQLHAGVGTMKSVLLESMRTRFNDTFINSHYTIATLLDPRYKASFFTAEQREAALEKITEELNLLSTSRNAPLNQINTAAAGQEAGCDQHQPKNLLHSVNESFWECYSELSSEENVQGGSYSEADVLTEISLYMSMPLIKRKEDPMCWWRSNKKVFKNIALLAIQYLSAPGSTVCSERLFSETGNIYEANRNR